MKDVIYKIIMKHTPITGSEECSTYEFQLAMESASDEIAVALKAENARLREALRRYMIHEEWNGYELLSSELGACPHPESSVHMEEWLDRVLRNPARKALEGSE